MTRIQAVWYPSWYNLDQSLEVGKESEYALFRCVPEYLKEFGDHVFFNESYGVTWKPTDVRRVKAMVKSITNSVLGAILRIDTSERFDYTITLADGTELLVNAEEEPGKLYERRGGEWVESTRVVDDWRMDVELSLCENEAANQSLNPTGNKPAS